MEKLNLYVWTDFYPDYSSGMAFAIAASREQAMDMIYDKIGREPYGGDDGSQWGPVAILPVDSPVAFAVKGGS